MFDPVTNSEILGAKQNPFFHQHAVCVIGRMTRGQYDVIRLQIEVICFSGIYTNGVRKGCIDFQNTRNELERSVVQNPVHSRKRLLSEIGATSNQIVIPAQR